MKNQIVHDKFKQMKNYIILVLIALASCNSIKQEKRIDAEVNTVARPKPVITGNPVEPYQPLSTFNGDTLKYVQANFLNRKEAYINKPLEVLLKELEIPIKDFLTGSSGKNINISPDMVIQFFSRREMDKKIAQHKDPVMLVIYWSTPLNNNDIVALIRKGQGNWTKEVEQYFGKQLVEDIEMVNYNF